MTDTPPRGIPKEQRPEPQGGDGAASRPAAGPTADFYRLLVESVQDYAIFALDTAGRVMTWSAGAARLKGYARTEIIGRHFSTFYPPEDAAAGKPERELATAAREGRLEDEGWRVRKDGTRFWASVVITALRDELGTLVGFAKVTRDLSVRRREEDALRESEERFRLLVESVRDYAIFLLDAEGHVATWNAGAERIKGYRAEEIVGRHFSTFYPEDKVASGFPEYELEVAAREGRFEDEGWRVRKDGSRFWANVVITALRDRSGRLVGFAKVTRDLTERRAAEEQARRLAAEEAARAEAVLRQDELRALTEQLQNQAIELEQQMEEAQALSEELEQTNDELQRALTDAVAAREQAERAVARTQQLQSLTASLSGASTLDDVARVVVAEVTAATGAASGMLALRIADADEAMIVRETGLHPDVLASYRHFALTRPGPAAECLRTGRPIFIETRAGPQGLLARFPKMPEVWEKLGTQALATIPLDVVGETIGAISLTFTAPREFPREERAFFLALGRQMAQAVERARLFAAEREAREAAEAARVAAEQANRAKSEFLATMSHELRTPLNAIGGYAQLIDLGVRGPVTAEQREDLERIMRSQSHLTGLINEVLNFARLESRAVTYELAPARLADVIASTAPLVEPQRLAKRIALEVLLPGAEVGVGVRVLADQDKLQQILLNLLSNAVKFTPEGGQVTIELLAAPDARGRAVLRVRDTGIGVPSDKLEAIFEPFVQIGRSLRSPGEGTGLGLAIARNLARGMGGDLTADSVLGTGSTFTLALPLA